MPGIDSYTKLCLHCDGTDESTTFTDSSASGHTVTAIGSAQVDTAEKKWGTGSCLLPGGTDYLRIPSHADFNFGSGDFAIDLQAYASALGSYNMILEHSDGTSDNRWFMFVKDVSGTKKLHWYIFSGGGEILSMISDTAFPTGQWRHVALSRTGTSWNLYQEGTRVATATSSASGDVSGGTYLKAGIQFNDAISWNGWLDEIRISKGTGRDWTGATITVPMAPYAPVNVRYSRMCA